MGKKRRSRQFRDSSQVIDIDDARQKRREKRKKQREKIKQQQKIEQRGSVRRSVRNNKIRRVLIYAVIIIAIVAVISVSIYRIIDLRHQKKDLQEEQKDLKSQKQELIEELKHLEDPDYIEEQARAQLRLVMPGETIYVFPAEEPKETTKAESNEN